MAETITLESLLQLTRRVFKGDLKRADLARRRSQKEVAFVGVAIMLARHEDFLDDQGVVLEAYDRILERLMSVGVVNRFNHEAGYKTGQNLVAGSRALELHLSIPMEGS